MSAPTLGSHIAAEDILSYESGPTQMLVIRFKAVGFEGAANLLEIMAAYPSVLNSPFSCGALEHAFVNEAWPVAIVHEAQPVRARVFVFGQHLHEKPEALKQFMDGVVPFLDASVLVSESDAQAMVATLTNLN